jgi:hypothetical protein
VDDALLVGVLHRPAHGDEEVQPLPWGKVVVVAVLGDRNPLDQVHDEVRPPGVGRAGVQHAGDVRVVHQGQGQPLGLEPRDDLTGVHPGLDELDRDQSLDRLGLLGHPHGAHAALADRLDQLVGADYSAGSFGGRWPVDGGGRAGVSAFGELAVPGGADLPVSLEERFDPVAQLGPSGAGPVQVGRPLVGRVPFHGLQKQCLRRVGVRVHGACLFPLITTCENGAESVSEKTKSLGGTIPGLEPGLEPGPGESPLSVRTRPGCGQGVRGFLDGKAREEPELSNPRGLGIFDGQFCEQFV